MSLVEEELVCPNCGNDESYWIQEVANRATWQPFTLTLEDDNTIGTSKSPGPASEGVLLAVPQRRWFRGG